MKIEYSKGAQATPELIQLHRRVSEDAGGLKTKVMLVFPPDWYPSEPYLSLPTLTSILRAAGHQVVQKDVNLEMYDWFFSADFLRRVLKKVPSSLTASGSSPRSGSWRNRKWSSNSRCATAPASGSRS